MGTLLSILGSIGIISNGAETTASTTIIENNVISEIELEKNIILEIKTVFLKELNSNYEIVNIWQNIPLFEEESVLAAEILSTSSVVEGGILAGSLGTAAETLGISLAIGAAIYGGYYAYQHWDSVKHFASETLKTTESYIASTTNYLKSWWPF
ncbi:hypothetical protein [Spiroplasma citri]|uniref:Putative transmembrane protein n=1 Tax=Spiroplasma citri TaxID=2133 RepID=Q3ZVH9_SPICI|nr:hypothetical protein [Spiroplasma citri]QED25644.1 hypothetical protein FRX96_10210 [Spiroplasma citri]QIA68022.1 hypothetical protein GMI18_10745 [Spiroplasma citri]QIA69908.1 hypothetical protein GL298_10805 [Spiroplasma citri]QIA71798.1 hypothetical protein GL981_10900 [Spiroplasma citri]QIA71875.1 hypothetical protein GL981_11290 [Spiroplasma citri]